MKYKPHSYQEYAIRYIETHPISALLIDMGLGKTSITLTAIRNLLFDSFEVCKVLVIAPLRVAKNTWTDEIKKWEHLSTLTYSLIIGNENERLSALNEQTDIYIINRENVDWLVNKSGYKFDFDMVVIDELSSFKNHQSKRFKSLMKVRPLVKRIVGLTGTPSSNGAIYDDEQNIVEIHDRKLETLEDIIESMNGKPLLIAYWYRHDLERIKSRFSVREIKTSEDISDWNDGKIPVALIHPASAGHGLNLQNGGSTLVWFGLTWSLELYQQTNARLYRQGQKNAVVIQHIITKGTIDEQILKALQKKNKTQADLIDAVRANLEV